MCNNSYKGAKIFLVTQSACMPDTQSLINTLGIEYAVSVCLPMTAIFMSNYAVHHTNDNREIVSSLRIATFEMQKDAKVRV